MTGFGSTLTALKEITTMEAQAHAKATKKVVADRLLAEIECSPANIHRQLRNRSNAELQYPGTSQASCAKLRLRKCKDIDGVVNSDAFQ